MNKRNPFPLLALTLLLSPTTFASPPQQQDLTFHQDAANSAFWVDGSSNLGDFNTVQTELDGVFQLRAWPFGSTYDQAQILSAHCYETSTQIQLEVPNPSGSPFLTVTIHNLVMDMITIPFEVDSGNGEFEDFDVVFTILNGTAVVEELNQSPETVDLKGLNIPVFHLWDQGTFGFHGSPYLYFEIPLTVEIPIQTASVDATVILDGYSFGEHDLNSPTPLLTVSQVTAGSMATATVKSATPNSITWLGYSKAGLGSEFIPQLGFHVDLIAPEQVGQAKLTNNTGGVSWTVDVPAGLLGETLWIQAVQLTGKTNVITKLVE
ncbi:MAG: hypothetical protein DWQ01_06985 [Planctomycetota bacterium]|nr:MAG: hypothetical protein DWQ01_06985 [Planctomycetota bacterium]